MKRALALCATLACLPASAAPTADAFLDSIGINLHVDQGYDESAYVEPLRYTGIREVRDGQRHVDRLLDLHTKTGVRVAVSAYGDLPGLLATARTLARAHALLAVEGPNEPNNFPIHYGGQAGGGRGSWRPVAAFQRDLYKAVKSDPALSPTPAFGPSEVGAETDDVGLQFLTVPNGTLGLSPPGTRFADFANVHNYVCGTANIDEDNQAWSAADPVLNSHWDGLFGNHGLTWNRHFRGYPDPALVALPRVTTETGWDSVSNRGGQRTQGTMLTNTYLAQFKRGWSYTFVYELRDGEGSAGHQGIYAGDEPKLAATYLHNLTTIVAATHGNAKPRPLSYAVPNEPGTVHDLLLAKRDGRFDLIVWDERVRGADHVAVTFARPPGRIVLYDITKGTKPVQMLPRPSSVPLTLTDHAMILEIENQ